MAIDDFVYSSYMAALPHLKSKLDEEVRKPELGRLLLDLLGRPDEGIPTILVTGSKGKGSTARMISFLLEEMGYRVGLFTSPHLLQFRERIRINGEPIPEEDFRLLGEQVVEKMKEINVDPQAGEYIGPIAISLALAFLYFRQEGVEVAVLEAGRGGLMDETNRVEHQAAVITPLFEEHLDRFGPTLSDVVRHKLGIVRDGVERVYIGRQGEKAEGLISAWRASHGKDSGEMPLWYEYGRDFAAERSRVTLEGTEVTLRLGEEILPLVRLPLIGDYQGENLALALKVVAHWTGKSGHEIIAGVDFSRFHWPGRGEVFRLRPLVILDGGIHRSSAESLLRFIEGLPYSRLHLLLSIPKDKDLKGVLQVWGRQADLIITTEATNPSLSFDLPYEEYLREVGLRGRHIPDPTEAYRSAKEGLDEEGILILMGTQSFVADMLRIPKALR